MARVLTFSRQFPKGHPRAGEPTYFVEKVLNSLGIDFTDRFRYCELIHSLNEQKISKGKLTVSDLNSFAISLERRFDEKPHTIRSGHRWKAGDMASPRVWSGIPYNSPQIIIAPDVEIKKVYDFEIKNGYVLLGNKKLANEMTFDGSKMIYEISGNDGLSVPDFKAWFKYPNQFDGQVICWKEPGY